MKFVRPDWTMVINGSWNVGIFTPPWVAANAYQLDQIGMEMELGTNSPVLRYNGALTQLIVRTDRLLAGARAESAEAVADMTNVLGRVLDTLSHTPVTGVGINFGFREEAPENDLTMNFTIADNDQLIDLGGVTRRTAIVRNLTLDGGLLRLKEELEEDGNVHFHLNFHFDVSSAAEAADVLRNNAEAKRLRALELMNTVYGLEPEVENA